MDANQRRARNLPCRLSILWIGDRLACENRDLCSFVFPPTAVEMSDFDGSTLDAKSHKSMYRQYLLDQLRNSTSRLLKLSSRPLPGDFYFILSPYIWYFLKKDHVFRCMYLFLSVFVATFRSIQPNFKAKLSLKRKSSVALTGLSRKSLIAWTVGTVTWAK